MPLPNRSWTTPFGSTLPSDQGYWNRSTMLCSLINLLSVDSKRSASGNPGQRLADDPASGRPCDYVRPGLRRIEQGKHVVFFRYHPGGILVSRILHERMLPERYAMEGEP